MIATSITLQTRVIIALLLRETRATFGTSRIGYLWAIITPAAGIGLLVYIFSQIGRQAPFGHSLALFFATGYLIVEYFNKLSRSLMSGVDANKSLLTYPVISDLDVMIARSILVSITYIFIMSIFFGILIIFNLADLPRYPEYIIGGFFATFFLGTSFGIFNAAIISLWASWQHIEKIITRPLIFISGIFYVPGLLPEFVKNLLWWNPVLHLVEWFRLGFYPSYPDTILTPWWPFLTGSILLLTGLTLNRFTKSRKASIK